MTAMMIDDGKRIAAGGSRGMWYRSQTLT